MQQTEFSNYCNIGFLLKCAQLFLSLGFIIKRLKSDNGKERGKRKNDWGSPLGIGE